MDEQQLRKLIDGNEDEHCEFKEAKTTFDYTKLAKYCAALSNEGGGFLIFGVTDKKPRSIVGSDFRGIEKIKSDLLEKLKVRIDIFEFSLPQRVIVFKIPSCPFDQPISHEGAYYMRSGENLLPMTPDKLKDFFMKSVNDYSDTIIKGTSIDDLDKNAIDLLRSNWDYQSDMLKTSDNLSFLTNCNLIRKGELTIAGLAILGKQDSISRLLPQIETIFEYRNDNKKIEYDKRIEYRKGFILIVEDLWRIIDSLNMSESFQNGLFMEEIKKFNESVIREALLNAFVHREYRNGNSICVKMSPDIITIKSPGGLPPNVTIDNIIDEQFSRNRLISETMQRVRYIERSGQGFDKMWKAQTLESKAGPDLSGTNENSVCISIYGSVHDAKLIKYLKKINSSDLSVHEYVSINLLSFEKEIPSEYKKYLNNLLNKGYIEKIGTARKYKYILSRQYYEATNQKGKYTKSIGLDESQLKMLIMEHLKRFKQANISEIEQVIPNQKRRRIYSLLIQLREENKIEYQGSKKTGSWRLCG